MASNPELPEDGEEIDRFEGGYSSFYCEGSALNFKKSEKSREQRIQKVQAKLPAEIQTPAPAEVRTKNQELKTKVQIQTPAEVQTKNQELKTGRRRWFLQFSLSSLVLIMLGAGALRLLESGWKKVKAFAYRHLPEPILEDMIRQPVVEISPTEDPTFKVQDNKLENEDEYFQFLATLSLKNITPKDVIRPHRNQRNGVCNQIPPKESWEKIQPTLAVADALQDELGVPLRMINSAYRSPEYNSACPGSASNSYHTKNMALDLVYACPPKEVALAARKLREKGVFKGGIGVYSSFVHIDTRGKNVDWGI